MKAQLILAVASLIAACMASPNGNAYKLLLGLGDTDACTVDVGGNSRSLAGVPQFSGNVLIDGTEYSVKLSPCAPAALAPGCNNGYIFYSTAANTQGVCFAGASNFTANTSNIEGGATRQYSPAASAAVKASMLLMIDAEAAGDVDISYTCGNVNELQFQSGTANGGAISSMTFSTSAICENIPTAAPTPAPESDDKLSAWAIVGIIAGCVVFIVIAAVVVIKCRSSPKEGEGEYSRV